MPNRASPPWLNVAPEFFGNARIAGAELGNKTATDAAKLAQEGIAHAQEIALKADEIRARREAVNAEIAGRNSRGYGGRNNDQENAIRQQQFDLNKQVVNDATARMAQQDAAWQEGQSRYQRAINAGDDPAAADLEILAPLRQAQGGSGGTKTANFQPPNDNQIVSTGNGGYSVVNKRSGEEVTSVPGRAPKESLSEVDKLQKQILVKEFDSLTRDVSKLERDSKNALTAALNPGIEEDLKAKREELAAKKAEIDAFKNPAATPGAVVAPAAPVPQAFMGTEGGTNMIPPSLPAGYMNPPMPNTKFTTPAPAIQNYPTATNKKTGARLIFKEGKWQQP